MTNDPRDGTLGEILASITRIIEQVGQDNIVLFQKFTCANCGSRQTMPHGNRFYTLGSCEACEHITDLKPGCGFTLASGPRMVTVMRSIGREVDSGLTLCIAKGDTDFSKYPDLQRFVRQSEATNAAT